MSKKTTITIVMAVCAILLIGALGFSLRDVFKNIFSGGGLSFGGVTYQNAEKYTAGEALIPDQVKNLDINWINGQVNVAYHKENVITLEETSNKEMTADLQLRWWVDGDTLRVQYAKSGYNLGRLNQEKQLTITLPEKAAFDSVSVDATSAELNIPALTADSLSLEVTSGDIHAEGDIRNLSAEATSGDMVLTLLKDAESIRTESTSGSARVTAQNVDKIEISTTSGGISVSAKQAGECRTTSTSGNVEVSVAKMGQLDIHTTSGTIASTLEQFDAMKIEATSGDVTLDLPSEPGFSANIDTTSGDVEYNIPITREGNTYICGDGSAQVSVDTTSGTVHLQ